MPIKKIADKVRVINEARSKNDRILIVVDGVHALGVENFNFDDLGVDFFVAGCHKWMFGPRGTGLVCGRMEAWEYVVPIIPPFFRYRTPGAQNSPGGFHTEEHRWALAECFKLHMKIGKANVTERIQALNSRMKKGLASINGVKVLTPIDPTLSAGLICFMVEGFSRGDVVKHLYENNIISAEGHYEPVVRIAPGLLNDENDIDKTIQVIGELV